MKRDLVILHLSLLEGIGAATINAILSKKPNDLDLCDLYTLSTADFINLFGFNQKKTAKIVKGLSDRAILERECTLIAKHSIEWITLLHDAYPHLLKNIHVPPPVLYWKGEALKNENKKLAIIGSRKANYYGKHIIESLVPDLVGHNWTIVSGGALGADSMAHRATLKAGGKTIVVLGSGLLCPYPASNRQLFKNVIDNGGMLLSSFPLTMEAQAGHFPARNRIISGLSRGCVVVQAARNSGARITANFALEQGREVFAVPGPLADELSAGCHALIQQGAKLITGASDILEEFGECREKTQSNEIIEKKVNSSDTSIEQIIVRYCAQPCSVDDLALHTGLNLPSLYALLFDMQLNGYIAQNSIGMWHAV